MKSLALKIFAALAIVSMAFSTLSADAVKGQKYYLKTMKPKLGYNGTKFAAKHTQAEWEALFANDGAGFIAEFSKESPKLEKFLNSDKFKEKIMPHIKDFAIMYANDSGNVPSC